LGLLAMRGICLQRGSLVQQYLECIRSEIIHRGDS